MLYLYTRLLKNQHKVYKEFPFIADEVAVEKVGSYILQCFLFVILVLFFLGAHFSSFARDDRLSTVD